MSRADMVRNIFTDPIQRTWTDKGVDYPNAPVEAFSQDPVMPTQVDLETVEMNRKDGGRVNSMLGSAKAPNEPTKGWWE